MRPFVSRHTRRPVSAPSSWMSNALSRPANDSATTRVDRPAHVGRTLGHHLGRAVHVDDDDLAHSPVGEPQSPIVPAGGLDHRQAGQQGVGCGVWVINSARSRNRKSRR